MPLMNVVFSWPWIAVLVEDRDGFAILAAVAKCKPLFGRTVELRCKSVSVGRGRVPFAELWDEYSVMSTL
jgi:hypothetical protein